MKKILWATMAAAVTLTAALAAEDGIKVGPLRLSIWGEISGTYDDNVRLVVPEGQIQDRTIFSDRVAESGDNQEEDIFLEGTLGLRLFRTTDHFFAELSGLYTARRYQDFDDLDNEAWVIDGQFTLGNPELDRVTLGARGAYREVFDYEKSAFADDFVNPDTQRDIFLAEDRTERVSRQLVDLGATLTWQITDKLGSDFSVGYGEIDYDTERLFDWNDTKGQAEFDYKLTDKTSALLTGQYGVQDSDALDNDPDYYVLRGGFLTRSTDKLTFKGGAGFGSYDRFRASDELVEQQDLQDEIESEADDSIDYFAFDLAGDWDLSQRTKLQAIGRNAVQPAAQYNDNVKIVTVASVGLSHRLRERIRLAATVSYRFDDYEDPVEIDTGEFILQEDTIWGGQLRVDYERPNGRINVYAAANYEDRDTTLPDEDYNQLRLTLGLKVKI